MSLSWSGKAIKYILFIFNLVFVISGIVLLSVGVTIKAYYHEYESFLDDQYFSAANLLIAIGVIIFVIAFFGCCGAVKENYCMTITFSTLLILVFILQLAAGIAGYALRNSTAEVLATKLNASLVKYNPNSHDEITTLWDTMQREFKCCGVHGPADWSQNSNFTEGDYPMSCCAIGVGAVGAVMCNNNTSKDSLHNEGCVDSFGDFIRDHAVTIGGVGIGFAFVQLLGIVFACHLSRQIKQNYDHM